MHARDVPPPDVDATVVTELVGVGTTVIQTVVIIHTYRVGQNGPKSRHHNSVKS